MRAHRSPLLVVASLAAMLVAGPLVSATDQAPTSQTIAVEDTLTGSGPCGFAVQRDIEGEISLIPSIDAAGNLVLTIDEVSLHGTLTNQATGKTVELKWVKENGRVGFGLDADAMTVTLGLTGHFFRGYDTARSDLGMELPADGAALLSFAPGERSEDPWTHVCGQLS